MGNKCEHIFNHMPPYHCIKCLLWKVDCEDVNEAPSPRDPQGQAEAPGSMPELSMSDEEIMEWAKSTYGHKLPEKIAELRAIVSHVVAESRRRRKA